MFGRGQLELGTDTVRCPGESNGQGQKYRAIDVEARISNCGCWCGCLTKNTS